MSTEGARVPHFRTKQELVYRTLRDEILSCTLQPEQRLVIEEIARRLLVSAIPVREALQLLQSEGLVTLTPHVGAIVAPLSRDSVVDVFSVLEGLQVVAARLCTERADAAALNRLGACVAAMDWEVEAGRHDAWAALNTTFHSTVGAVSGLPLLRESSRQALDRWDQIRRYFYNGVLVPRVATAQRDHHELMAGFTARDVSRVETSMRRHYQEALGAYLHYFDSRTSGRDGAGVEAAAVLP